MGFKHGSLCELWLNGQDISTFFNQSDVAVATDDAPTPTFKNKWKAYIPGQSDVVVSTGGYYDPTFTKLKDTLQAATDGVFTTGPAGMAAIGDLARLVLIKSVKYGESSPIGGAVAFKWDVKASGVVGFGYALHPLAADTDTTTGASHDDGASNSTGAIAHLHVTAVSAGSWVVKIQDSATGSSGWADIGTFAAVTDATNPQRIVIAGTVRRYVRYVATRTGGSSSDSVTFGLAIART